MFGYVFQQLAENWTTICVVVLVYVLVLKTVRRPANFPPGPWAIPFIGSPGVFGRNAEEIFSKLREKYGDVFCVYAGPKPLVVIGGLTALREGLVKLGHVTSNRPDNILTDLSDRKGLLSAQGQFWKEQRAFTVSKLRQFGMGKVSLESRVLEEVELLVEFLESTNGQPVDLWGRLKTRVANVILKIVYNKRFDHGDQRLLNFLAAVEENFSLMTPARNTFPWLRYIPGDPFKFKTIAKNYAFVETEFCKSLIDDHKNDFQAEAIRDFTDAYLAELQTKAGDSDTSFSENQLMHLTGDLSVGGTDTTSVTMAWGILYLTLYPDVQRKVQAEVDSVVGSQRHPSIIDRTNLLYTDATLMEIQRIANIGFFLPPHLNSKDIEINGFTIPMGTTLLFMVGETLSDPKLWENPKHFNPDRFIKDGKLTNTDKFFPFSMGPRSCPGEALAKLNIFLFFTTLMQKFTFKFPDGEPAPSTERVMGLTIRPRPFNVCAIPR